MASSDAVWARGHRPVGAVTCKACDGEGVISYPTPDGIKTKTCRICAGAGWGVTDREEVMGSPSEKTIEQYAEEKVQEKAAKVATSASPPTTKAPTSEPVQDQPVAPGTEHNPQKPTPTIEGTGQVGSTTTTDQVTGKELTKENSTVVKE
jgi:hypothetical protein